MDFTPEQLSAIERRGGDLLVDAGAGSGKTSVLVERFVRAVVEDGVEVGAILTITFTDKAAAELRDRIRTRLREHGDHVAARATEGAFISTIHGFCARVLRANALAAGIDPAFSVLDERESERLADAAFDAAIEDLGQNRAGGIELIAAHGVGSLRGAILATYAELRSRGEQSPGLPMLLPAPDLEAARLALEQAATLAARELGSVSEPSARVLGALERLGRCGEVAASRDPWPGDLRSLSLPGGNGAALSTAACLAYGAPLERFRLACEHSRAGRSRDLLDHLLRSFSSRYAQHKRERSALDFEDLELITRELLRRSQELLDRYSRRFDQIMVDELQDTNRVQLELIESIARGNLFTVGDAQQSIYAFRHADVELFERRGQRLSESGGRITLRTNFRSRGEILKALNTAFIAAAEPAEAQDCRSSGEAQTTQVAGGRFTPLIAGRTDFSPAADPLVELLIADKGAQFSEDGLASPWRLAEAGALARRVGELIEAGAAPRDVVVLSRASTDLRAYERALEQRGVPTYVIGGRGYWSHPQVLDMVAYLCALANPRDEEALYTVLSSPLVGVSLDALVVLAAASRAAARDPWWILREPEGRLDELRAPERERLAAFAGWFAAERPLAARVAIEELIDRALERTGYDLAMLEIPGGERRLANVRKLMRLAREHEASGGRDLHGFLALVRSRSAGSGGLVEPRGRRESEAPVEGEALDAVRLMTIHRAKGLEFEIVCVADLGRGPRRPADLLRVGRDGRLGLRLAQPGTGKREPALDYVALGEERCQAEALEERRLFYVAMTRARERLILSGAAKLQPWGGGGPIAWIGPAFVPDIALRAHDRSGTTEAGVRLTIVGPDDLHDPTARMRTLDHAGPDEAAKVAALGPPPCAEPEPGPGPEPEREVGPPVARLSYSSLEEYQRCGYRFYAERVLGLPRVRSGGEPATDTGRKRGPTRTEPGLTGAERGILAHALLERLDFRRPVAPSATAVIEAAEGAVTAGEAAEIAALVRRFADSELCARLGSAAGVRREQRFAFLLDREVLFTGALDVLAREDGEKLLVVDYKSDRLEGADPHAVVQSTYASQRLIYALAAIHAGAALVEVTHVFLELPERPIVASFAKADGPRLEHALGRLAAGVRAREFEISGAPHRALCNACPAEGGLCSWPLAATRREAPDRLF